MARYEILKAELLHHVGVNDVQMEERQLKGVAQRTEGFVARDLHMLLERAIHAHRITHPGQ